jgi:beta-glucanase (GH16 family)
MPMAGMILGLCFTGLMIWYKLSTIVVHKYCPVLIDDFSSGMLDPTVWTKEVEVGGYGNHQFEMTTASDQNVFVQNGQLHIKPTLQNASLIETNTVINLLADGSCTSAAWSNCVTATNTTNGTIVNPVLSGRLNTKLGANIRYGKVEVSAMIPKGDWLWPGIWMMPKDSVYGAWPASGEIDIMESRGNNYTYSLGGNNFVSSSLHWGPDPSHDAWRVTTNSKPALHSQFGDQFHTYGLIWSEKYLFTYIDDTLLEVLYWNFNQPFWPLGDFGLQNGNGTNLQNPWQGIGNNQSPFDQEFYLILNVAVGGTNGWFLDGADGKPWVDSSPSARKDFWNARDQWYPTWAKSSEMVVDTVKMWRQCD